ncbi:hypothetical protein DRO97_05070 [Archaeoglobales archaeon]|nr:MAG: hypothetical protein DRO97_05070 [Archaeoglobales archaeon]
MLEYLIHQELYNWLSSLQLEYNGQPVSLQIWRAKQTVKKTDYPCLFINYLDAIVDKTNTPLNEILKIELVDAGEYEDVKYNRGVILGQSIDLNLYDNDIQRIAKLQNDLFLAAKKDLTLSNVTVFDILPPRMLDFTEEEFIYRRIIEVVCKYEMTWDEIVKTIESVEYSVDIESG